VATSSDEQRDRALKPGEWQLLAVLGLPTFAYALATTVATTYLPVLAQDFTGSSTVVGLLIAVEGIMALLLAVPAGALSDRRTSRLPFVRWGSPVLVVALAAMGFATSLPFALVAVVVFFAAYFVAYEPYRALYPDLVDPLIAGRGQSTQALWRGLGTIVAIATGGVLLTLGKPVPFLVAAGLTAIAVGVFLALLGRRTVDTDHVAGSSSGLREDLERLRELVARRPSLRAFMVANALWELSLGATKTFIILYLTVGLGLGTGLAGLAVAATAVFIAAATPISGRLADRFGTVRVMRVALLIYGAGLLVPFIVDNAIVVGAVTPLVGFGGGVVMTLPYALLIPLMGDDDHGLTTGLYSVSRGVGTALGPLLAGVAIGVLDGPFSGTEGYQAMWGVCAAAILLSVPFLTRLRDETSQQR
jgi:MFS family permease